MNNLCSLLILSLALSSHGALEPHIVGGEKAKPGQFPYQVSIRYNGRHFCGGSIISKHYILTAGHCVLNKNILSMRVHTGTNYLSEQGDVYELTSSSTLARREGKIVQNDVALLKTFKDIKFSNKVQPVKLGTTQHVSAGTPATASGWGRLWDDGQVPDALQNINLTVISNENCKMYYPSVKTNNICTFTKQGEGVCNGDSGGPLVADGFQIGIVSYGTICASGYPDVYARVANFTDWIDKNLEVGEPPEKPDSKPDPGKPGKKDPNQGASGILAPFSLIALMAIVAQAAR